MAMSNNSCRGGRDDLVCIASRACPQPTAAKGRTLPRTSRGIQTGQDKMNDSNSPWLGKGSFVAMLHPSCTRACKTGAKRIMRPNSCNCRWTGKLIIKTPWQGRRKSIGCLEVSRAARCSGNHEDMPEASGPTSDPELPATLAPLEQGAGFGRRWRNARRRRRRLLKERRASECSPLPPTTHG